MQVFYPVSIDRSRKDTATSLVELRILWQPERERIERIIVKNARGHAFFELGEPRFGKPSHVYFSPLEYLDYEQRQNFETIEAITGWPEVGSRMMTRMMTGQDLAERLDSCPARYLPVRSSSDELHICSNCSLRVLGNGGDVGKPLRAGS